MTLLCLSSKIPFDPTELAQLGQVAQIFGVINPFREKSNEKSSADLHWKFGFITRNNVKPFGPELPANYFFGVKSIKDFVLTKLINGYIKALACPPMNRLFYLPRAATIAEVIQKELDYHNK